MPRPTFSAEPSTDPAGLCLRVRGDLDMVTAPAVREAIVRFAEPLGSLVVVDITGVDFIDSTGIGALVAAQNALRSTGQAFTLRGVGAGVHRVLDLAGVTETLRVEPATSIAS